jgi:hypothetical protein
VHVVTAAAQCAATGGAGDKKTSRAIWAVDEVKKSEPEAN